MGSSCAKTPSVIHLLVLLFPAAFAVPRANAGPYTFVNVADSDGPYEAFEAPHLNDAGGVSFYAWLDNLAGVGIFRGPDPSRDAVVVIDALDDPFEHVEPIHGLSDTGTVAFAGTPRGGARGIFTGPDPTTDAVATTDGPYFWVSSPVVSANGTVMFVGQLDNLTTRGIYRGRDPARDTVVDTGGPYGSFADLRTNDAGAIAFHAGLDSGAQGIFTGPDPAVHMVATDAGPFQNLSFYPDINNSGVVLFLASLDGTTRQGIFNGPDPVANAVVTSDGPYFGFTAADLNDAGRLAFLAELDQGGSGIFTGPDPVADKVIVGDDPLFGSTVTAISLFDGLNERGDIAFSYALADGRRGIAVAVLPEPTSLSLLALGGLVLLRRQR